jgi:hypothetical protein
MRTSLKKRQKRFSDLINKINELMYFLYQMPYTEVLYHRGFPFFQGQYVRVLHYASNCRLLWCVHSILTPCIIRDSVILSPKLIPLHIHECRIVSEADSYMTLLWYRRLTRAIAWIYLDEMVTRDRIHRTRDSIFGNEVRPKPTSSGHAYERSSLKLRHRPPGALGRAAGTPCEPVTMYCFSLSWLEWVTSAAPSSFYRGA